jgi:hypothetical protein
MKKVDKDILGKTLYGFDAKSFRSYLVDLDVDDSSQTMHYQHMHYLNEKCNPSYDCWKNSSLAYRIKYRLFKSLRRKI